PSLVTLRPMTFCHRAPKARPLSSWGHLPLSSFDAAPCGRSAQDDKGAQGAKEPLTKDDKGYWGGYRRRSSSPIHRATSPHVVGAVDAVTGKRRLLLQVRHSPQPEVVPRNADDRVVLPVGLDQHLARANAA